MLVLLDATMAAVHAFAHGQASRLRRPALSGAQVRTHSAAVPASTKFTLQSPHLVPAGTGWYREY